MQAIITALTFIIAGVLISLTTIEPLRRVRFVYLVISSLLFFIAGVLTGIYLG